MTPHHLGISRRSTSLRTDQGGQSGPSRPASIPGGWRLDERHRGIRATNPVYAGDFPDPMIARLGCYLAGGRHERRWQQRADLTNTNLGALGAGPDALPHLPDWSQPRQVWAPEIAVRADGRYLLYDTTRAPFASSFVGSRSTCRSGPGPVGASPRSRQRGIPGPTRRRPQAQGRAWRGPSRPRGSRHRRSRARCSVARPGA